MFSRLMLVTLSGVFHRILVSTACILFMSLLLLSSESTTELCYKELLVSELSDEVPLRCCLRRIAASVIASMMSMTIYYRLIYCVLKNFYLLSLYAFPSIFFLPFLSRLRMTLVRYFQACLFLNLYLTLNFREVNVSLNKSQKLNARPEITKKICEQPILYLV